MKLIILAGGGGTRLWPFSRIDYPKQFLHFGDNETLLEKTINRLKRASFVDEAIIVTNAHYAHLVEKQISDICPNFKIHVVIEPYSKNTAPAIAFAIKYMQEKQKISENEKILILPSDHLISPEDLFLDYLKKLDKSNIDDKIIAFGIKPSSAQTGYGYIKRSSKENDLLYNVDCFIEKPDEKRANELIKDPDYYWNSGMFFFTIKTFWKELEKCSNDIFKAMNKKYIDVFNNFQNIESISIDFAIMEKTKKIFICPMSISWSDMGSWDGVYDVLEKDNNQNVKIGNVLDFDTTNSLIIGGKRLISTIGLDDVLIVETKDAIFMSKKGDSQKVKNLVKYLRDKKIKESFSHREENTLFDQNGCVVKHINISPFEINDFVNDSNESKTYFVIQGTASIIRNNEILEKRRSEIFTLEKKDSIEIENKQKENLILLEICYNSKKEKINDQKIKNYS
jgi:mannose-1-phosphate guanylyltransferase / mannose-6-phosphate isomerase